MSKWFKKEDNVSPVLKENLLMVGVLTSEPVVVKVNSKHSEPYLAIATYNDYGSSSTNSCQGRWSIYGHNGNWDHAVLGWFFVPDF